MRDSDIPRFVNSVNVGKLTDCWEWGDYCFSTGYGAFCINRQNHGAHRIMYQLVHGKIANSRLFVCHSCDNPRCVNPMHLFLGTVTDNMRDAAKKGRMMRGERNNKSRLTEANVRKIREIYSSGTLSQRQVAKMFNVSQHAIMMVTTNQSWKHLE